MYIGSERIAPRNDEKRDCARARKQLAQEQGACTPVVVVDRERYLSSKADYSKLESELESLQVSCVEKDKKIESMRRDFHVLFNRLRCFILALTLMEQIQG
jgi:hypothetical protein